MRHLKKSKKKENKNKERMNYEYALTKSVKFLALDDLQPQTRKLQPTSIVPLIVKSTKTTHTSPSSPKSALPLTPPRLLELRAKLQRQKQQQQQQQSSIIKLNVSSMETARIATERAAEATAAPSKTIQMTKSSQIRKLHTRPF